MFEAFEVVNTLQNDLEVRLSAFGGNKKTSQAIATAHRRHLGISDFFLIISWFLMTSEVLIPPKNDLEVCEFLRKKKTAKQPRQHTEGFVKIIG